MAFQVSPGVNVSEIDTTTVVPAISTSIGAIVGNFQWGPLFTPILVSNENELVSKFGKPNNTTANDFFTAANFLAYSNAMRVIRVAPETAYNATSLVDADVQYKDETDYANDADFETGIAGASDPEKLQFAARYPGALGNSLKVEVWANTNAAMFGDWTYSSLFDAVPGTSNYVAVNHKSNANDELHLVVVDEDGLITGTANTVLERFANLSKATNAKDDTGQNIYFRDVLLRQSKWVYWAGNPNNSTQLTGTGQWGVAANSTHIFGDIIESGSGANTAGNSVFSFVGGADETVTTSHINTGYDVIKNSENVDISLITTSAQGATNQEYAINTVCGTRKDCIAFISPPLANVLSATATDDVVEYRNDDLTVSSSYGVMDSGWKYQYDKYNDIYRWVPLNGDVAGLCARTDNERDPWFSPAGFARGQIKNVVKLAFNPNKASRDELYKAGVNPVVSFPGEGTVLFGDKTMLGRPSAFDRINVRRLFIVLEKAISRAARSSLFEFNDEFTRAQFVNLVEPFLRNVQGRRGIYDFRVICDDTNNTSEVIDRNEFIGDIYIKPAKSINFIQLNFVAVRTGVSFEEIVGRV